MTRYQPSTRRRVVITSCLGCFALPLVLIAALFVLAAVGVKLGIGGPATDTGNPYTAQRYCQQAIRDQLKAPATAAFSQATQKVLGNGRYDVFGMVDADNSFGAKLIEP